MGKMAYLGELSLLFGDMRLLTKRHDEAGRHGSDPFLTNFRAALQFALVWARLKWRNSNTANQFSLRRLSGHGMTDSWIAQCDLVCRYSSRIRLAPGGKTCKTVNSRWQELRRFLSQTPASIHTQVAYLGSEAGYMLVLTDKPLKELVRGLGM